MAKYPIVVFISSYGDNPQIFEAIESIRKNVPRGTIFDFHDCISDEHYNKVKSKADCIVRSNVNMGSSKSTGYSLLYLDFDYLIITADDMIFPENYENILTFFNDKTVGCIGENKWFKELKYKEFIISPNKDMFPDAPMIIPKRIIDEVGSISPQFGGYGYQICELQERIFNKGHKLIVVNSGVQHKGQYTREKYFPAENKEVKDDLKRNIEVWQNPNKIWWELKSK